MERIKIEIDRRVNAEEEARIREEEKKVKDEEKRREDEER